MKSESKLGKLRKRKKLTTLLGLTLDGHRLEGVVLHRTGDALVAAQTFSGALALDPLTAAPELAGREIRNLLDAAGVREKHCIVGLPLKWILTAQTELPALAEADAASLLQMEAERGFHTSLDQLQLGHSRCALGEGKQLALLASVHLPHVTALETILAAAKLKPVSFTLGLAALAPAKDVKEAGLVALAIGESVVGLQITVGGGIAALRALEGAVTEEAGHKTLQADLVARETRITLGQLPETLRAAIKRIRIFGPRDLARQLADELELKLEPFGLEAEVVAGYAPNELGLQLPPEASLSPAFSLAARWLAGWVPPLEFLPPKPGLLERLSAKYASGRYRTVGLAGAGIGVILLGLFLFQQVRLWRLRAEWSHIAAPVGQLQVIQDQIHRYRPWFDDTYRNLSVLRLLSIAFPQDGSVTAKTIQIRDNAVTCSGTVSDTAAWIAMQANLRQATNNVTNLKLQQIRGSGKNPMTFTINFNFKPGDAP